MIGVAPWLCDEVLEYDPPPHFRYVSEPGQGGAPRLHVVEVVSADDPDDVETVAVLKTKAAARRLCDELKRCVEEAKGADEKGEDVAPIYAGAFIADREVHPAYEEEWKEFCTPPEAAMPDGVRIPDGFDVLDIFDRKGYPQQRQFLRAMRRFQLFLGGRGTGKSNGLGYKAFILSFLNPGCPGLLLSRTYNELHTVLLPYFFHACQLFREATGIEVVAHYNRSLQIITLINGSRIYLRSWDRVDKLRAQTVAWIVLDEIEHGSARPMYAFQTAQACIRHPGARYPQFCMATTPNGLTGVTAHFVTAQRDEQDKPEAARVYHVTRATVFDNPYVDDAFRDGLRLTMSKRDWDQEGMGRILGPRAQVFVEYDEARHIIPWKWDNQLPYMLLVDWGTSHAFWCMVQVRPASNPYGYQWVVAREQKLEDVGPMDVRRSIEDAVRDVGYLPALCASDRAVTVQKNWLAGRFGSDSIVLTCETKSEQDIDRGLTMMRFMLDPPKGEQPLLVFAASLGNQLHIAGRGLLGAMVNYRYRMDGDGTLTNDTYKDNINDHPVDALRYGVVTSANFADFHGGDILRAKYGDALRLNRAA